MSLKQTIPPDPLSPHWLLSDIKSWLRIDDSESNTVLTDVVDTSLSYFENATNRQLFNATWQLKIATFPNAGGDLILTVSPLQSVTSVTYVNTSDEVTTWDAANYVVDTDSNVGRIRPAYNIDYPSDVRGYDQDVVVTFVAGYGTVKADIPEPVQTAIKMLSGHYFENRESTAPITLHPVPTGLEALIWQFKDGTIQ